MKNWTCPISGVNIPRFALSVALGFLFVFGFDYLVHAIWLMPTYQLTPQLWRVPEDMMLHQGWMMMCQFLIVLITAFLFTRNFESKGILEGLRFGLMVGALMGVGMMYSYGYMPISLGLALSWGAAGLVQGAGLGVIYALTYRCSATQCCGGCGGGARTEGG